MIVRIQEVMAVLRCLCCYRAKIPSCICLFVSHITCKHALFFFFAQIIITSSIHNTFVHVKTFLVMPSTNATIVVRTPFQFEPMFAFWVLPHKIKSACCQFQRINNDDPVGLRTTAPIEICSEQLLTCGIVEDITKMHDTRYDGKNSGSYGCIEMFSLMAGSTIAQQPSWQSAC